MKERFKKLFLDSINKIEADEVAIAFSGDIDSALLVHVMKKNKK